MSHFSSTQYNSISREYDAVNDLPISRAIVINIERVLSPHIQNARVLELACGTGFFTRHLLDWGAASIVGVDISQAMIDTAQENLSSRDDASKCRLMVADCSKPFGAGSQEFDIVFAAWLLNYSATESVMEATFDNISKHLKPGGRLITVAPHAEEDPLICINKINSDFDAQYGYRVELRNQLEVGYHIHLFFSTEPKVSFGNYYLPKSVYERAARAGGMKGRLWWEHITLPDDHDKLNTYMAVPVSPGYFDEWLKYPDFGILNCREIIVFIRKIVCEYQLESTTPLWIHCYTSASEMSTTNSSAVAPRVIWPPSTHTAYRVLNRAGHGICLHVSTQCLAC